jgi:hypothetical protein
MITNNKYFFIDKKKKSAKKDQAKQPPKGKLSKTEWFESLDVEERIEAVSTIVTDNSELINCIKNDIKKIENKYKEMDNSELSACSNEDYLNSGDHAKCNGYYSQNWQVSIAPEFPG